MNCDIIEKCLFFRDRLKGIPAKASVLKRIYCRDNNSRCARYLIFRKVGSDGVPEDLFPNNYSEAFRILASQ